MGKATRFVAVFTLEFFIASLCPAWIFAGGGGAATIAQAALAPESERRTISGEVTPERGGRLELDGVRLEIPAGAVRKPTVISITALPYTEGLSEGMMNVTGGARGYRFEPHGMLFSREVLVRMPFDGALLDSETALANLFTYFHSDTSGRWERLRRIAVDREGVAITSATNHFTDMINATLKLPEGPTPIQFDVNSIKNLEAADPAQGVPTPNGLQPGPFGAASFSLNFRLPKGRGNATPSLALRYTSDATNGWLGKGFDMEAPSISIDTRFGLPGYDGNDRYFHDGEELACVDLIPNPALPVRTFRPYKETSFQRILWIQKNGESYWEVTDKIGDVREYGRGEGWIGPDRTDRTRTFIWYLTRMRDPFGNTVDYRYSHDAANAFTYLSEIIYSGHEGSGAEGAYRVAFTREDREDRRMDSRGRFLSKLTQRLSRVDVYCSGSLIRSYLFHYLYNEFGQSQLASYSETDALGNVFYTYSFDYYALSARADDSGGVKAYDAFEGESRWNVPADVPFDGLGSNVNLSAGGSLYVGVSVFGAVEVGARGGLDLSLGYSIGELVDLNSDGLPDVVWEDASGFRGYLNGYDPGNPDTAGSFGQSGSTSFVFGGVSGWMNEETQVSGNIGFSAGALGATGSLTWGFSGSDARTSFMDVNGDGRVDFIRTGSGTFGLNAALEATPWTFGDSGASLPSGPDLNDDRFQRAYFLQEPVRKWKTYRSGTVDVEESAHLTSPGQASGVNLDTYYQNDVAPAFRISLNGTTSQATPPAASFPMERNDALYFHVDTLGDVVGDDVVWNVKIRYTAVRFFEDMANTAEFHPPASSTDPRLAPIYEGGNLKSAWWNQDERDLLPVYQALVEYGWFVPRRLTRVQYDTLRGKCPAIPSSAYVLEPETGTMYLAGDTSPFASEVVANIAAAFSKAELLAMAGYRWPEDGAYVFPGPEGSAFASTVFSPIITLPSPSEIRADGQAAGYGSSVLDKGVLLDRLSVPAGGEELLWLRGGRVFREVLGNETEITGPALSVDITGTTLDVRLQDRGVERTFALLNGSSLIERLPASLYSGAVSDYVLKDETFSTYGYSAILKASWDLLPTNDANSLSSFYTLVNGVYEINTGVTSADLVTIFGIIDPWSDRDPVPDTIFDAFPADPAGMNRLVALSLAELNEFTAGKNAGLRGSFLSVTVGPQTVYYPDGELSPDARTVLHDAMARYRRDVELFPFYTEDEPTQTWGLRAGLTPSQQGQVSSALVACGLVCYGSIDRRIVYRSEGVFQVTRGTLPAGGHEELYGDTGGQQAQPGQACGVVEVLSFDPEGESVLITRYIHDYNSFSDYDPQNLVGEPLEGYSSEEQPFRGGVNGWFFGAWTGYYAWDASLLGQTPTQADPLPPPGPDEIPDASAGQVTLPPYFLVMNQNDDGSGKPKITADGRDPVQPVSLESWVGPVSSYSDVTLDASGNGVTTEFDFAAYIHGDTLHASRSGGDTYSRIPRGGGGAAGAGGTLGGIRASKSETFDVNGGIQIGGIGASLGNTTATSWGYLGLMDINGDRYPDSVSFDGAKGGAGSFSVSPGTGSGFGAAQTYSLPSVSHLTRSESDIFNYGASASASSGSTDVKYSGRGKISSVTVKSASFGVGVNGTCGSSVQTEEFMDVNGDGLADHLRRDADGGYAVELNTGTTQFAGGVDWGSGISAQWLTGLNLFGQNRNIMGLSHSSTGSFGANLNVGLSESITGGGVSIGYSGTVNKTYSMLEDINGDGLADQVVKLKNEAFFRVRFNLGDRFSAQEVHLYRPEWSFDGAGLKAAVEQDIGAIVGLMSGSSSPGANGAPTFSGLPDAGGTTFGSEIDPFVIDDVLDYTSGAAFNLGAHVTVGIPIWLVTLKISGGVNGSVARTSSTLRMTDVDGDGLPDHVAKLPMDDFYRVKRNTMGKAGLLKTIRLPMGGSCVLDYGRAGNTVSLPQSRWVMTRVTRNDGLSAADRGEHSYSVSHAYKDGYYDRDSRLFWGFGEVRSLYGDSSELTVRYRNDNYHTRGMEERRVLRGLRSGSMEDFSSTDTTITEYPGGLYERGTVAFAAVTAETHRAYDALDHYTETRTSFAYDGAYGNVTAITEDGNTAETGDELYAGITYDESLPGYFRQHPDRIRVVDSRGTVLRQREGEYGEHGELVRLTQYESLSTGRSWDIGYDAYGNLASITDPRGSTLSWEYDDVVHSYVMTARSSNNGLQLESRSTWDYSLGVELTRTDVAGEKMRYGHDRFGRLTEIWSPYDTGTVPCVSYDYLTGSLPWQAVTLNKVSYDPLDIQSIQTLMTIDGLGRAVQTAKQGEVRLGTSHLQGWNLSGAIAYDAKARPESEGHPVFAEGTALPGLAAMRSPTVKTYDCLDRVLSVTLPDTAATSTAYLVRDGRQVEQTTDPRGNITERVLDARGNAVEVRRLDSGERLVTNARYTYNTLGEILSAADQEGNAVISAYDMLGRRIRFESPDAGIVAYTYDASGNLSRKVDSARRSLGQAVEYHYDGLNRLVGIDYPHSADVTYTYGGPGAANGGAGRIVQLQDETGTTLYRYGRLGETTGIERTVRRLTPLAPDESAALGYQWDYLGRLQRVTYPDGEEVSYGYDYGGQVQSVTGTHGPTAYVKDIGYDEFGQRVFISYGNDVETSYTYNPERRWLDTIHTEKAAGNSVYQNMSYSFDAVGNVLGVTNSATRYGVVARYTYDALSRLTRAEGELTKRPYGFTEYVSRYSQAFTFDPTGNLTDKTSTETTTPQSTIGAALNYSLDYQYYGGKAHQPERIGQLWYLYDANGNMVEERQGGHSELPIQELALTTQGDLRTVNKGFALTRHGSDTGGTYARTCQWDEENRLKRSVEGNLVVDYRYGADGQRAVKYNGSGETIYFDPMWQETTFYPGMRQSKHIYVGQTRIATRCGIKGDPAIGNELASTYYYHSDHLGSAQLVTDFRGEQYEHFEYTPYGELWLEETSETVFKIPFRFTGKELDEETGLYYYGARYLNPRTSMWISADPAMERYLPVEPSSDDARKRNASLPGMGGVFNTANLAVYAYAGNNPVKYSDPDGREIRLMGGGENVQMLRMYLQTLTNDPLRVVGGKVVIAARATTPSTRPVGTELIRRLVDSAYVTLVTASALPGGGHEQKDKTAADGRTVTGHYSSVRINLDFDFDKEYKNVVQGGGKTSLQSMLGHELIHAYEHGIGGNVLDKTAKPAGSEHERQVVGLGVYKTQDFTENKLRQEQGDAERLEY